MVPIQGSTTRRLDRYFVASDVKLLISGGGLLFWFERNLGDLWVYLPRFSA